jgi:hypothetical protein
VRLVLVVLLSLVSANPAGGSTLPAATLVEETLLIRANGTEAFTSLPLDKDATYAIHVWGVIPMSCWSGFFTRSRPCDGDALFSTDRLGNFAEPHNCLAFSPSATVREANRATHEYDFTFNGSGGALSVKLTCPPTVPTPRVLFARVVQTGHRLPARLFGCGTALTRLCLHPAFVPVTVVTVLITVFTIVWCFISQFLEHERAIAEQRRAREAAQLEQLRRRRKRAERLAKLMLQAAKARAEEENRQRREGEQLRREEEQHQRAVTELVVALEHSPRYEDPEFLRACAGRLLEDEKRVSRTVQGWDIVPADAARQLQDLHRHPRRVAILQERAPQIYQRLLWKVRLREIVERQVAMGGTASPETRAGGKITVETFREKQRVVVAADDQLGFEETLHERLRAARERLAAQGLPEDEIEGSLRAIEASMREVAARTQNRGGDHDQQL